MNPFYHDDHNTIYHGDCAELIPQLTEQVDSIVTDPPYGLRFMGKHWDYDVPAADVWRKMLGVIKPGGHILVACGTRTQHRMAVNIEDAGFEIRDLVAWVYGSGFPKSLDISKGIDKLAGAEREVVGIKMCGDGSPTHLASPEAALRTAGKCQSGRTTHNPETAPATEAARQWSGWGTALKPAMELWTLARAPLSESSISRNVLKFGAGGLNIDACRVDGPKGNGVWGSSNATIDTDRKFNGSPEMAEYKSAQNPLGRFPANFIHDGSEEVVSLFPDSAGAQAAVGPQFGDKDTVHCYGNYGPRDVMEPRGDEGSAARFFYCAKAATSEREAGLLEKTDYQLRDNGFSGEIGGEHLPRANHHPTVKPLDLMRYLVKLITPPGGIVLDPFLGSGTTAIAAKELGMKCIGIEREEPYCKIAAGRCSREGIQFQMGSIL